MAGRLTNRHASDLITTILYKYFLSQYIHPKYMYLFLTTFPLLVSLHKFFLS